MLGCRVHGPLAWIECIDYHFFLLFSFYFLLPFLHLLIVHGDILTMPFVFPAPSPQPPKAPTSPALLSPSSQPIPSTSMTTTTMTNFSSLPPPNQRMSLQTVSQRMVEISKERAAKRKREREARQRGYSGSGSGSRAEDGGGSWSGGSLGDESIVSSAESSLESRDSQQPTSTSTSASIVNLSSPDNLVVGHIPIHHSSIHAVRNTDPARSSAQAPAEGPDILHTQLHAHIPTPGLRTAVDTSGPNTTRENIGSSLSILSTALVPTPTEEMDDDDDADLKRLMNQAENMLKIVDTPIAVGSGPQSERVQSQPASQRQVGNQGTPTGDVSSGAVGAGTNMMTEVLDGRK